MLSHYSRVRAPPCDSTAFDSSAGNDILIMIAQGGNEGTQTINNAANKISGHRSGTYAAYPVPGEYQQRHRASPSLPTSLTPVSPSHTPLSSIARHL